MPKPHNPSSETFTLHLTPKIPIPEYLCGEVQSKLAYVDEGILSARVESNRISLVLRAHPGPRTPKLEAKVHRVVASMAQGAIKPKVQILEDYLHRSVPYSQDPMEELQKRGEVFAEASGTYTLGPLLTQLIAYFESLFHSLAHQFQAVAYRFPVLISAEFLERVKYFSAFPHSLSFVTHLREDLEIIDGFSQQAHCEDHSLQVPHDMFARVKTLLSPAVCYHLYFSLADKPVPRGRVVATAVGNCFRYEAINLNSLERLWNFTMREIIFVGDKDFVLDNREAARRIMEEKFEALGLAYRVESANDPFFIGEFRKQAAFQSAFQLKYEIRARLPFKERTLAVGSYNYHQDFFGRHLNITLPNGEAAHTGCVAFGLERMAFAFLAQFGFDKNQWPSEVKEFCS